MGATTNSDAFLLSIEGVLARKKTAELSALLSKQSLDYPLVPITSIRPNEEGEYNITNDIFTRASQGELYDGDSKVLQWIYDKKGLLVLEAFTDKQLNIFGDLRLKECLIKASGPLFLDGKIHVETTLGIAAEALLFADNIECTGVIALSAQQGVGLLAAVTATHLTINAAHVHQGADLHVSGQIDISTQSFKQEPDCITKADSLRLVALQCKMEGNLTVTDACFLTANSLALGNTTCQSTLNLPGNNHIHVGNLAIEGDTQFSLGDTEKSKPGSLTIDQHLFIDELALVDLRNTDIVAESIDNKGELITKECTLEVDEVLQDKIFDAEQSQITIFKRFNHGKHSLTGLKNNNFFCHELNGYGGKLTIDACHYKGMSCSIYSGRFDVNNHSKLTMSESLLLDEKATSTFKECEIAVKQQIDIVGKTHFEHAEVETDYLRALENKVGMNHAKITAHHLLKLTAGAELTASTLLANDIHLSGDLAIHDVNVRGKCFNLSTAHAEIDGLISDSDILNIEGSPESDQVLFKKSVLTTKLFSCRDHVTLDQSLVYGIDERKVGHDLRAKLKLSGSKFITESQLTHHVDSTLDLNGHSMLYTGLLYSQGAMRAKDSTVFCDAIVQEDATLKLDSSPLYVDKGLFSRGSRVTLKNQARVVTPHLNLGEGDSLTLEDAIILNVSEAIVTLPGSIISSDKSTIATKKLTALGRTELCASMLYAEELHIYDEFAARDKSSISIDRLIAVAKEGRVKLSDTLITSPDVRVLGEILVHDSSLAVSNKLSVFSEGSLILQGNSVVLAEDMLLSGTLTTATTTAPDSEKDKKTGARVKVNKLLTITEDGKISGDEDLFLEAEKLLQHGNVSLSAALRARGTQFTNYGSVCADSIHLGYDDAVVNWGRFSADNMTVHSNFINVLGGVHVKQSYSCTGLFGLNLGLIAANNYSNSNLISFNGGVVLPNFSADYKYIFSVSNMVSTAKIAATMIVPGYTSAINLAFMLPGLASTSANLYSTYQQFGWEKFNTMRRHEWMPLISQLRNAALLGWSAVDTAYAASGEFSTLSSDLSTLTSRALDFDIYTLANLQAGVLAANFPHMGLRAATAFAGSYMDSSLLSINMGASLAGSTAKTNLLDINTGIEASILSHNINTHWLYNGGLAVGTEATFLASSIYNSGEMEGLSQFTLKADHMVNASTGSVDGTHVNVTLTTLEQLGHLSLSNGQVKVGKFSDTAEATTDLAFISMSGEDFRLSGTLDAERTQLNYVNKFSADAGSIMKADNTFIKAGEFIESGQLNYQHILTVEADKATLAVGSTVNGAKTAEEDLFVDKPTDATADTLSEKTEKEFSPEHVFNLRSQHVALQGRLTGGDYTHIAGLDTAPEECDEEKKAVKCEDLTISEEAEIDLTYGSIAAKSTLNLGSTALHKFHLDLDTLEQQSALQLEGCVGKIAEFKDVELAATQIKDTALEGDSFQLRGKLDAANSRFEYKEKFTTTAGALLKTDNVEIATNKFEHAGQLNYQHQLLVTAEEATLSKSSLINGEQTAEDQLFVVKVTPVDPSAASSSEAQIPDSSARVPSEATPVDSSQSVVPQADTAEKEGSADAPEKEPEKDFKPQHMFTLQATRVVVDGGLTGGDYTQIHGKPSGATSDEDTSKVIKCESLIIGETAAIDLSYGSIAGQKADISGQVKLSGFDITLDSTRLDHGALVSIAKSSVVGDVLNSSGTLNLDGDVLTIGKIDLGIQAKETIKDTTINATSVCDDSKLAYEGQVVIITDHYEHGGKITKLTAPDGTESRNLFYVKANEAALHGAAELDSAYYDIKHLKDGANFVAGLGPYSAYHVTDSLVFATEDSVRLVSSISRDCDVTVQAADITMTADYKKAHDLTFISTVGDVSLMSDIISDNLYVQSAHDIWTNHSIYTSVLTNFEAAGGYYNLGGTLNADVVAVKAREIKNVTSGSAVAQQAWGKPMGSTGIINGRTGTYLEATEGSIENYGGIIRGGEYTQLIAKGNVLNACNIRTYKGAYDVMQAFDGGLIAGGSGVNTDGIGLYVKAGGMIISDASDFVSNGTNYLEADKGFNLTARQHTYVSDRWTTKTWYGKKTKHSETSTTVKGTVIHSATGVNILRTEHGGLSSVATRFSSPGGTQVYARDDVLLYSLKSKDRVYDSKSTLWGLSKSSSKKMHESSTPTLFVDNGVTRITSTEGSVDARGAYFIGAGDLSIKAQKRIKFGVDTLDHEVIDKSRSLGVSVPGMSALGAWADGGSLMDVATAEDATLAKLNGLLHSANPTELMANSANLGINLYNTTNSVMRGLAGDTLSDELLSRYGLGRATGFAPAITFSMIESKTTTKYQTLAQGGVDRGGSVSLEAGEGIDLENGVRVHADGDMDVSAPEVIAKAAALHSTMEQKTMTQSISVAPTGQFQDASVGYSKTSAEATNYVNAELSAGGKMKLHCEEAAIKLVELDGAIIVAGSLDADIDKLIITDKQDVMTNHVESASASVSGQVSVYKGDGGATITAQQSGIHVVDGINTDGHSVHVGEATMIGGKITTDGVNLIQIDKLVAVKLHDEQHYSGIGISLNLHDLERLAGKKATNDTGEQAIAIAAVSIDRVAYQAELTPVIYGTEGTAADIKELVGEIHTSSADGRRVVKDDELHLLLDVPITNSDHMSKSRDTIQAGFNIILEAIGGHKKPDETNRVDLESNVLPAKREEEEEEEEEELEGGKELGDGDAPADKEDKSSGSDESIPPEELKEIFDHSLSDLKFDSPEEKEKFEKSAKAALDEQRKNGFVSDDTLKTLNENIKSAILQTLKAGSEESWSRLTSALGHDYNQKLTELLSGPDGLSKLGVKSYMSSKGLFITFCFNLGLASIDSKVDKAEIIRGGVTSTAADITFGALLKFSMGSLSGPVGWTFIGLGILDNFTYSQSAVDKLVNDGIGRLNEALRAGSDGSYFAAFGLLQVASYQIRAAGQAQALHELLAIPKQIADGFGYVWDKVVKPVPSVDRNSFFSSEDKKAKSKSTAAELALEISPSL